MLQVAKFLCISILRLLFSIPIVVQLHCQVVLDEESTSPHLIFGLHSTSLPFLSSWVPVRWSYRIPIVLRSCHKLSKSFLVVKCYIGRILSLLVRHFLLHQQTIQRRFIVSSHFFEKGKSRNICRLVLCLYIWKYTYITL